MPTTATPTQVYELRCFNHIGQGRRCNALIGSSSTPKTPTRVISDVRDIRPSRDASWCKRCNKATEFEQADAA